MINLSKMTKKNLTCGQGSPFISHEENKAVHLEIIPYPDITRSNSLCVSPLDFSVIILFKVTEYSWIGVNALVLH